MWDAYDFIGAPKISRCHPKSTPSLTTTQTPSTTTPPGFFRRLGAIVYDSLLLLSVLFVATALILPFNDGEAFRSSQYAYPLFLLLVSLLFFGWFWTHGGQTLGMRAWKIKVCSEDSRPIGWTQATARFAAAILSWGICGLGFVWILFDKRNRGWHDILTKTQIVRHDRTA